MKIDCNELTLTTDSIVTGNRIAACCNRISTFHNIRWKVKKKYHCLTRTTVIFAYRVKSFKGKPYSIKC